MIEAEKEGSQKAKKLKTKTIEMGLRLGLGPNVFWAKGETFMSFFFELFFTLISSQTGIFK